MIDACDLVSAETHSTLVESAAFWLKSSRLFTVCSYASSDIVPDCFAASRTFSFSPRIRSVAASKSTSKGLMVGAVAVAIVVPPVRTMTIYGPAASYVSMDSANTAICDQAHVVATGESLGGNRIGARIQISR